MNKILVGMLFGLILGAADGASAWFYPEVRSQMTGILVARRSRAWWWDC